MDAPSSHVNLCSHRSIATLQVVSSIIACLLYFSHLDNVAIMLVANINIANLIGNI